MGVQVPQGWPLYNVLGPIVFFITNKPSNKNKRSKLISISILAIGLIIFAVSQFFMGNVVYLYKRYVNGSKFSMGEYQYKVSEEFVIFDKSDILLEASIDNYWPKDLSFCDVVKPIAV